MRLENPPTNLREGDILAGKYVVERVLGAGGMGVVLAGRHSLLGSPVAIKVLLPSAAEIPGARERFVREARAAAALRSEHVARVTDVGLHDDGTPYLVMEYLSGIDLRKALRARGPMPVADVAEYMVQVCEAMAEAHGLGIVHRDLKPGNLFLTQRPNGAPLVKVLDFGLAKVLEEAPKAAGDASLTATGLVVGSPPYMPPEQLRSLKLADARSDIWSLGVVLFELLTGRQPFLADRAEGLIVAIATDHPPPPRSLRPDIPESIHALILRCLQKDPRERPQTVRELAAVMEPFVAPRGAMASAATFGLAAPATTAGGPRSAPASESGAAVAAAARDATIPMTRVTFAPEVLLAAATPPAPPGGTTTLTSGSAELLTRRAPSRRPKTSVLILGAAGAAVFAGAAGVAIGLSRAPSESAEEAPITSATLDLPSPQPASKALVGASAGEVASAPLAVTASPSGAPSVLPGLAASPTTSTTATPSPAPNSALAQGTSIPRGSASAAAPAVPATPNVPPPKPRPAGVATGKPLPDPLKQWN